MLVIIHSPPYRVFADEEEAQAFAEKKAEKGMGVTIVPFETQVCPDQKNVYTVDRFKVTYSRHFYSRHFKAEASNV